MFPMSSSAGYWCKTSIEVVWCLTIIIPLSAIPFLLHISMHPDVFTCLCDIIINLFFFKNYLVVSSRIHIRNDCFVTAAFDDDFCQSGLVGVLPSKHRVITFSSNSDCRKWSHTCFQRTTKSCSGTRKHISFLIMVHSLWGSVPGCTQYSSLKYD